MKYIYPLMHCKSYKINTSRIINLIHFCHWVKVDNFKKGSIRGLKIQQHIFLIANQEDMLKILRFGFLITNQEERAEISLRFWHQNFIYQVDNTI